MLGGAGDGRMLSLSMMRLGILDMGMPRDSKAMCLCLDSTRTDIKYVLGSNLTR
jgi:hypothetical protein